MNPVSKQLIERCHLRVTAAFLLITCTVPALADDLLLVAKGGTQAPGLAEGVSFNQRSFEHQSVNAAGQVVFKSVVTGGLDVVYFGRPGELQLVAIEDSPAPGTDDGTFCQVDTSNPSPTLIASEDGSVAFAARVLTPDQVDNCASLGAVGIWIWNDGVTELLAIEGGPAADSDPGVIYSDILPTFRHTDQGTVFRATLYDSVGEVALGRAILSGQPGNVQILARIGDPAPEVPGSSHAAFGDRWPHNNSDQSTFWSNLDAGGGETIYRGNASAQSLLWRSGTAATEFGIGWEFGAFAQIAPRDWGLNDRAEACFSSVLKKIGEADVDSVWRDLGPSRSVLASASGQAPGLPAEFEFVGFSDCWINESGRVLLRGSASSTQVVDNRRGLWLSNATGQDPDLTLITAEMDVLFDHTEDYPVTSVQPLEPHVNRLGSVAFEVTVLDDGGISRQSIWIGRGSSEELIAIGGQTVTVDSQPAVLGPLLDFGVGQNGSGNEDGNPSAISDKDQVVFNTILDGGPEAILLTPGLGDLIFKDGFEMLPVPPGP